MVSATAAHGSAGIGRGHLRDMGLPTMFGAIVLLVSATMLLGANISALKGNLGWMDHSHQVLNQIDMLETTVLGEELTVRGYALTQDARFITYQHLERGRSTQALANLKRLAQSEGARLPQFQAVEKDVERHMAIFDKLGAVRDGNGRIVAQAIIDPAIRANMRHTRDGLAALRAAEMNDFAARQRDITNQLGRAFALAVGIILAAFVLAGLGVWATQLHGPLRR